MAVNLILVILWIISGTLSSTWSISINKFSARNAKYGEIRGSKKLLESIGSGAQMALEHCQLKFKWDRWNCPETAFSRRSSQQQTRETAFVSALKAAGIVHSITRNCSQGELLGCGCTTPQSSGASSTSNFAKGFSNIAQDENSTISLGGCNDNVEYGEHVARVVLDEMERGSDLHALVVAHNNAAGRMIIRKTMRKHCRCHGVSGSCSLQTCWMQMAPFSEITNELRIKYEEARKVNYDQNIYFIRDIDTISKIPQDDLVYLNDSPNYCKIDLYTGWNGTKGRSCSRNKGDTITPAERKSCKNLCRSCGHRVRRERRRLTKRCNCTFHWCCEVKCDTCTNTVNEFFCE